MATSSRNVPQLDLPPSRNVPQLELHTSTPPSPTLTRPKLGTSGSAGRTVTSQRLPPPTLSRALLQRTPRMFRFCFLAKHPRRMAQQMLLHHPQGVHFHSPRGSLLRHPFLSAPAMHSGPHRRKPMTSARRICGRRCRRRLRMWSCRR